MPEVRKIKIASLVVDPRFQLRVTTDDSAIDDAAATLRAGGELPPVDVFELDGALVLVHGFHRTQAHILAGREEIEAQVYEGGTEQDAFLHSASANTSQKAVRWTRADAARAAEALLLVCPEMSFRKIAEASGCTHPTVSKIHDRLVAAGKLTPPSKQVEILSTPAPAAPAPASEPPAHDPHSYRRSVLNNKLQRLRAEGVEQLLGAAPGTLPVPQQLVVLPVLDGEGLTALENDITRDNGHENELRIGFERRLKSLGKAGIEIVAFNGDVVRARGDHAWAWPRRGLDELERQTAHGEKELVKKREREAAKAASQTTPPTQQSLTGSAGPSPAAPSGQPPATAPAALEADAPAPPAPKVRPLASPQELPIDVSAEQLEAVIEGVQVRAKVGRADAAEVAQRVCGALTLAETMAIAGRLKLEQLKAEGDFWTPSGKNSWGGDFGDHTVVRVKSYPQPRIVVERGTVNQSGRQNGRLHMTMECK